MSRGTRWPASADSACDPARTLRSVLSARRPLPDVAICLARPGIVASPGSGDGDVILEALFAHEKERMVASRFDNAESTLDCAEAVLADRGESGNQQVARYQLVRRCGILDYRRERIPEALSRFECALSLSEGREDRVAVARDLKNVGSALRRLGDFRGALRVLTDSLEIQRGSGEVSGAVLNNIADVYREIDNPDEAMGYYREALAAFQQRGEGVEAAHVLETMSAIDLARGQARRVVSWLQQAQRNYHDNGNRAYESS